MIEAVLTSLLSTPMSVLPTITPHNTQTMKKVVFLTPLFHTAYVYLLLLDWYLFILANIGVID